ncbi:MAG: kinase-like domain-containing protein, partial [Benjaminiella poitrasii]
MKLRSHNETSPDDTSAIQNEKVITILCRNCETPITLDHEAFTKRQQSLSIHRLAQFEQTPLENSVLNETSNQHSVDHDYDYIIEPKKEVVSDNYTVEEAIVKNHCSQLPSNNAMDPESEHNKNHIISYSGAGLNLQDEDEDDLSDVSTIDSTNIEYEYREISRVNIIPPVDPDAPYNTRRKRQRIVFDINNSKDTPMTPDMPKLEKVMQAVELTTTNSISKITTKDERDKDNHPDRSQAQSPVDSLLTPKLEEVDRKQLLLELPGQIQPNDLLVSDLILGEGQIGVVKLGTYRGLQVACKTKRKRARREPFEIQARREIEFAVKLSACRYVNRYFGWVYCSRHQVEADIKFDITRTKKTMKSLYIVQRYVPNGDARSYLDKRVYTFQPQEVLQASICLFSALADAHVLGIGIVDLKLENFLIDSSGAGWLTDFGSCIEFKDKGDIVDLDKEGVFWTKNVAPPEMLYSH